MNRMNTNPIQKQSNTGFQNTYINGKIHKEKEHYKRNIIQKSGKLTDKEDSKEKLRKEKEESEDDRDNKYVRKI